MQSPKRVRNPFLSRLFVGAFCGGMLLAAGLFVVPPIERLLAMRQQPLVLAVYNNNMPAAKRLLDKGADVDADFRDPDWEDVPRTALMIACERGNAPMVRLLLDHGAGQYSDGWGNSPLSLAHSQGNQEVVNLLTERTSHPSP